MNKLTICCLLIVNFAFAQNSYKDIFVGITPKWNHITIDSTMKDSLLPNGVRLDGLSHIHSWAMLPFKYNDNFIVSYINNQNDGGYFIDNVDINTGEQIWKLAFDLRHSKREEALLDMYVSENNKLNLLNIRNAYNTNNISWGQGTFARKELDLSNGKLLKSISYNDISEKIPELYVDYLVNRLFKHGDGQFEYLRASSDYFQNTKIDRVLLNDEGCFISVDTIRMKRKYLYGLNTGFTTYNSKRDTLLFLNHSFNSKNYHDTIKFDVTIEFFDANLNRFKSLDVTDKLTKFPFHEITFAKNNYFIIHSAEFASGGNSARAFHLFDLEGNLIEKFVFPNKLRFNTNLYKLPHEPGCLLINTLYDSLNKVSPCIVQILKSNGNSNLTLLKEFKLNNGLVLQRALIEVLDNNDLIMVSRCYKWINSTIQTYQSRKLITRFDAKEINLISQNVDYGKNKTLKWRLHSTLVKDQVQLISQSNDLQAIKFEIFSIDSKLLKNGTISTENSIINIENLRAGIYLIKVFDGNESIILKFIKE
jgi:hypothetical protein